MPKVLLDNDGTNFFRYRMADDVEDSVRQAVEECSPAVDAFLLCPNCCGKFFYPTEIGEVFPDCDRLIEAHARDVDPFGMLLRAMKDTGREVLITFRMNDVHGASDPDHPGASQFKRDHPDLVVDRDAVGRANGGWMAHCLDYSRREVREYILSLIDELVDRYGKTIDGVQLDWMRFPRHLSGDAEDVWSKRVCLTEVTARVRERLHAANRKLTLGARVPNSVAGWRRVGLDVSAWGRDRLVDYIVAAGFLATDCTPPIEPMRSALGGSAVLYTDIQMMHGPQFQTPESLRGAVLSQLDAGSDGIYLFNFPCWIERAAAVPYHWLDDLADPVALARKPVLLWVPHTRTRKAGIDCPGRLPVQIDPGDSQTLTVSVPHAVLPGRRACLLVESGGDVDVRVNGLAQEEAISLRRSEIFPVHYAPHPKPYCHRPDPAQCRVFLVGARTLRAGENAITVHNSASAALEINRINLALWPKGDA